MIRVTQQQVAKFVLQNNWLDDPTPTESISSLFLTLCGFPSQPSLTPYVGARLRLAKFLPTDLITVIDEERQLINARLMRGQRFFIPTDLYPIYFAATARQRKQDLNSAFRQWDIENSEIESLADTVLAQIDAQGPLLEAELAEQTSVRALTFTSRGGRVSTTTNLAQALRWLQDNGLVYGVPVDKRSPKQHPTMRFHRLQAVYPELDLSNLPDEATAQTSLVRNYLTAFSPATEADISFWTGFGKSETARALNALSSETTLTLVEGIPGMTLLLKNQAETLTSTTPNEAPLVHLLPADDPFVTAHRASRTRYFTNQKLQRQVFNSKGAAKPTILVDGKIVGIWEEFEGTVSLNFLEDVSDDIKVQVDTLARETEQFLLSL